MTDEQYKDRIADLEYDFARQMANLQHEMQKLSTAAISASESIPAFNRELPIELIPLFPEPIFR